MYRQRDAVKMVEDELRKCTVKVIGGWPVFIDSEGYTLIRMTPCSDIRTKNATVLLREDRPECDRFTLASCLLSDKLMAMRESDEGAVDITDILNRVVMMKLLDGEIPYEIVYAGFSGGRFTSPEAERGAIFGLGYGPMFVYKLATEAEERAHPEQVVNYRGRSIIVELSHNLRNMMLEFDYEKDCNGLLGIAYSMIPRVAPMLSNELDMHG